MSDARCPSLIDLFAQERQPGIDEHVADCVRCQALLAGQEERVVVDAAEASEWQESADAVEAGAVVLLSSPDTDEYLPAVVAKVADDAVTIVPVSEHVELAAEWDFILDASVLGYEAMAEVWNFGSVLPEQVAEHVVTLRQEVLESLRQLLRAAVSSGEVPEGVPVGVPVLSGDDVRLLFHDEESERTHAYWEPTLALAGAANLAQLVAHRRSELALAAEELESVSLAERGWLERLEQGTLDIQRVLRPPALASLMRRLQIGASRRLARIAAWTLEEQSQTSEFATGAALARKRVGTRASAGEESVADYVDAFMRELQRQERE
ncbi:MAG TPA: hypothetical protein VK488_15155 [Gaiellaceae bacterium]|nr:hypothetical protein [Gaiellaceae bacterium]